MILHVATSPATTHLTQSESALIAAGTAAVVAVVVALINHWFTLHRETVTRRYERRRVALNDVHDAARLLRENLRSYGLTARREDGARSEAFVLAEAAVADADSAVDVLVTRVDSPGVVDAVEQWRLAARVSSIDTTGEDVTVQDESTRWQAMNRVIGSALKSREGMPPAGRSAGGAES